MKKSTATIAGVGAGALALWAGGYVAVSSIGISDRDASNNRYVAGMALFFGAPAVAGIAAYTAKNKTVRTFARSAAITSTALLALASFVVVTKKAGAS